MYAFVGNDSDAQATAVETNASHFFARHMIYWERNRYGLGRTGHAIERPAMRHHFEARREYHDGEIEAVVRARVDSEGINGHV